MIDPSSSEEETDEEAVDEPHHHHHHHHHPSSHQPRASKVQDTSVSSAANSFASAPGQFVGGPGQPANAAATSWGSGASNSLDVPPSSASQTRYGTTLSSIIKEKDKETGQRSLESNLIDAVTSMRKRAGYLFFFLLFSKDMPKMADSEKKS